MKSIKLLSLLFVIGEYYLRLLFCLTRFLLALYVSTSINFIYYYNVSCFLAVVPCAVGAVFLPFSQEATLLTLLVSLFYLQCYALFTVCAYERNINGVTD